MWKSSAFWNPIAHITNSQFGIQARNARLPAFDLSSGRQKYGGLAHHFAPLN